MISGIEGVCLARSGEGPMREGSLMDAASLMRASCHAAIFLSFCLYMVELSMSAIPSPYLLHK